MPANDNAFKRAARYNDAQAEDHGLHGVCAHLGIDAEELLHISAQRALRLVLTESGRGAELSRITSGNVPTPVRVSDVERRKIDSMTAAYMDGIVIGWRAARENRAPITDVYSALAEHIGDGRLDGNYSQDTLREFLSTTDRGGGDPDWERLDDVLDSLTARYLEGQNG